MPFSALAAEDNSNDLLVAGDNPPALWHHQHQRQKTTRQQ